VADLTRIDTDRARSMQIRVYMANRGGWESGWWLCPTVSVAHDDDDVDRYVELFGQFVAEVSGG
jgi:hypothetical protein